MIVLRIIEGYLMVDGPGLMHVFLPYLTMLIGRDTQ
jgi:hypothetical protein